MLRLRSTQTGPGTKVGRRGVGKVQAHERERRDRSPAVARGVVSGLL
jgi:hypothetical protein